MWTTHFPVRYFGDIQGHPLRNIKGQDYWLCVFDDDSAALVSVIGQSLGVYPGKVRNKSDLREIRNPFRGIDPDLMLDPEL